MERSSSNFPNHYRIDFWRNVNATSFFHFKFKTILKIITPIIWSKRLILCNQVTMSTYEEYILVLAVFEPSNKGVFFISRKTRNLVDSVSKILSARAR